MKKKKKESRDFVIKATYGEDNFSARCHDNFSVMVQGYRAASISLDKVKKGNLDLNEGLKIVK